MIAQTTACAHVTTQINSGFSSKDNPDTGSAGAKYVRWIFRLVPFIAAAQNNLRRRQNIGADTKASHKSKASARVEARPAVLRVLCCTGPTVRISFAARFITHS